MKRLVLVLSIVCLPTVAFAGIQNGRTGPGARIGTDSTSVGAVFEMASLKPTTVDAAGGKPKLGDALTSSVLMLDAQLPLGPAPVRIRVPFLVSAPEGGDSGIGNVSIGVAKGMELGMGIETALTVGVDLLLPTQGEDNVYSLSPYRQAEFGKKLTTLVPHGSFSIVTPLIDARLDLDFLYGLHQSDNDDLDRKGLRLGATVAIAVIPLVQVVVGADWMKSIADDAPDASTFARVGIRGGAGVVDFGLEANLPIGGPVADAEAQGVGIVASVSAGF